MTVESYADLLLAYPVSEIQVWLPFTIFFMVNHDGTISTKDSAIKAKLEDAESTFTDKDRFHLRTS